MALLSTSVAAAVLVGGCSSKLHQARPAPYGKQAMAKTNKSANPLHAATTYWATQHLKNQKDPKAALNYALNLKAVGSMDKAMQVLATGHKYNPDDPAIASEYGRLALAAEQTPLAERLLDIAMRETDQPDWKLLSAKGTLHAKKGESDAAQRYYQAALQQKPDSLSTMNNLALSYALDGKAHEAEKILRRVVAKDGDNERVRQNLALVVGLQGKFSESRQIAQADLPNEQANSNTAFLRNMIRQSKTALADADIPETDGNAAPPAPAPRQLAANTAKPPRAPAKRTSLEAWASASDNTAGPAPKMPDPKPKVEPTPAKAKPQPAPWQTKLAAEAGRKSKAANASPTLVASVPSAFEALPWQTSTTKAAPEPADALDSWRTTVSAEPTRLVPDKKK